MNQSPKNLIRIMESRGWVLKRVKGSHHIYYNATTKDSISVPVHGNKDIGNGLFLKIIKKLEISIEDLNK